MRVQCILFSGLMAGMVAPASGVTVSWQTERESVAGKWEVETRIANFTGGSVAWVADSALSGFVRKETDDFVRAARKETRNPGYPMGMWGFNANTFVSVARPDLVSAYVETYDFRGGAHGMTTFKGFSAGMVNGKARILQLRDLFRAGAPARALAAQAVKKRLQANEKAAWFQPGADPSDRPPDDALIAQWVLTPSGITFLIEPYVAGPYAVGSFFVKVPYSEFEGQLDPNGPLKGLL